jgi:hypothetical protein
MPPLQGRFWTVEGKQMLFSHMERTGFCFLVAYKKVEIDLLADAHVVIPKSDPQVHCVPLRAKQLVLPNLKWLFSYRK